MKSSLLVAAISAALGFSATGMSHPQENQVDRTDTEMKGSRVCRETAERQYRKCLKRGRSKDACERDRKKALRRCR